MANKSILRTAIMTAVLAELKRDAGKLWVEPYFVSSCRLCWQADGDVVELAMHPTIGEFKITAFGVGENYTPARFRAALRKIKRGKG